MVKKASKPRTRKAPKPRGRWDRNHLIVTGRVRDEDGELQTLEAFIYRHRGGPFRSDTFTAVVQTETVSNRYGEKIHYPSEDAAKVAAESSLRKLVSSWIRQRKAEIRGEERMLRSNKILLGK